MRVDLIHLLKQREIIHPTYLKCISLVDDHLHLTFEGYTWWKDGSQQGESGTIIFTFVRPIGQLGLAVTHIPSDDEMLEEFSIENSKAGGWTDEPTISIYGQAPLPDPQGLFFRLHSYLDKLRSHRTPRDFLNFPAGELSQFTEITATSLYLLAQANREIADFIVADVDQQGIPYYTLENNTSKESGRRLIVRWFETIFDCEAAFAEFS